MLSITLLFIISCSTIIITSVDATTIISSATLKNNIQPSPPSLLSNNDRELQLFDDTNNSSQQEEKVEEKMEGTCFGNQLDSGQQRSQGSYLWYVLFFLCYTLFIIISFVLFGIVF